MWKRSDNNKLDWKYEIMGGVTGKMTPHNAELRRRRARRMYHLGVYKMKKGCEWCGWNEHPVGLDFDHINPEDKSEKLRSLESSKRRDGGGICRLVDYICLKDMEKNRAHLRTLINEIRKCRVLCSNCHRIKTYEERNSAFRRKGYESRGGSGGMGRYIKP